MPNLFRDGWEKTIDNIAAKCPEFVRVCVVAGKSFLYFHGMTRAAALTYTTFLAAVPLLILLTAIALRIGFGSLISDYLPILERLGYFSGIISDLTPILKNAEHVPIGKLGIIGSLGLFITFLLAIGALEINFNVVWENKVSRSFLRQMIVYSPLLVVFAAVIGLFAGFAKYLHDFFEEFLIHDLHFSSNFFAAFQYAFWFGALLAAAFVIIFLMLFALPYRPSHYPMRKLFWTSFLSTFLATAAIYFYTGIISHIQSTLFVRYSLLYGSLAFIPLLFILVFGIWSIILFANSLVWTICNWPSAGEHTWNWVNSAKNL